jgi:transaldolase
MKIFLDSANIDEIKKLEQLDLLDGVSLNLVSLKKEFLRQGFEVAQDDKNEYNQRYLEHIRAISTICGIDRSVFVLIPTIEYKKTIQESEKVLSVADNISIKLPITWDNLIVCKEFSKKNIPVNMSLCGSVNQALLVAKTGAKYVSCLLGQFDDIGQDGTNLFEDIRHMCDNYSAFEMEIVAESIRNPIHVAKLMKTGIDAITITLKVFDQLYKNPITEINLQKITNGK